MSKPDRLNLSLFETRVLWAISKQPLHGYAILKRLNSGRKKRITNGTLYPILQKLLKQKLSIMKKAGPRDKKVYSISKTGRKTLNGACVEFCGVFGEIFNTFICKKCGSGVKLKIRKAD